MSVFGEKSGYVSIGQTSHGNENGESHYIYATYPDLNTALDFSQMNQSLGGVTEFGKLTRTITRVMMQSWE